MYAVIPCQSFNYLLLWFTKDFKDNEHSDYIENDKDDHFVV